MILTIQTPKKKTIKRFSTDSIVEAAHMTQLVPECGTQIEYYVLTDSSFCVLSDQTTVIGVSNADKNTIVKQSVTDSSKPMVTYNANKGLVNTLGANESRNVLPAGGYDFDFDGQVVQYDLSTGQVVKAFGQVGTGIVLSSFNVNDLWCFGGDGESKVAVIDSVSRQALAKPVSSAIWTIYSMTVCKIQEENNRSKVLLFIVGKNPEYSENQTDVFDITALLTGHSDLPDKQVSFEC